MSILYCYPERDGKDFYLGFWLDVDDTEDERTWDNQAAAIAKRFQALYAILEEKQAERGNEFKEHIRTLSEMLIAPFAGLLRKASELRFVLPQDLVRWPFDLLELDGQALFLRVPVSYVLDDEVPVFRGPLKLVTGVVIADLTADPEEACKAIHQSLPNTEYSRVEVASNESVTDADAIDLLLISAHGSLEDDNSGEIDLNGDSLTSDELADIETTLVYFDSCGMGSNWDYLQTFYDEGSTRYYLSPITSNDAGDSSTNTMIWFFKGLQNHQTPEVALFETRKRLFAHYMKKRLDPIVVLNKAFPFRLYVFDNT